MSSVGVWVTRHALDQMRERGLAPDGRDHRKMAFAEVMAALDNGRMSKTLPRWAITGRGARWKLNRADRYVWPADLSRCYIITPHRPKVLRGVENPRDGEFKKTWTVVTVVGPRPTKEAV